MAREREAFVNHTHAFSNHDINDKKIIYGTERSLYADKLEGDTKLILIILI